MKLGALRFEENAEQAFGYWVTPPKGVGAWIVEDLAAHVAIVFKRLFHRARLAGTIHALLDSDETRADLEWFMQRYPLEHTEHERIAEGRQRIDARTAERERILQPQWDPGLLVGFRDELQPYAYQAQAAAVALGNPGLLLGDDVGLGKTISAFATAAAGAALPMAIVVQAHLADQWKRQAEKFTHYRVHIVNGTKPYDLPPADLYVFRYSNIAGWVDVIATGMFKSACWDEIQELRHGEKTAKGLASAALRDHTSLQLGLTATPIYNYGDEIHAVMDYIRPGLLGTRDEFMREWGGGAKAVRDPDALGEYLKGTGFFLRRREDDPTVDASLPPPNIIEFEIGLDHRRIDAERALLQKLAYAVLDGSFTEAGSASRELDLRVRQLTGIGKAPAIAAYVRLLLSDCERVLLTGWHREVYSIWQERLAEFNPVLFTGSESNAGKRKSFEAFTQGDARVMMISLRSGAGIDGLQYHCRDVVFGEFDWSPQVHKQIIGRLRRPGQTGQVSAHYPWANGGSDPVMMEMLGVKADQARGINDPGQMLAARHSDESRIRRLAQSVIEQDAG